MNRYSADSCSVQYFQPFQEYKYVPECLPEYENWSQGTPALKTYLFSHDMPNHFFESWQQQSCTNTDLEHNTSDWEMWDNNDNHGVARTSVRLSKLAVGYGTIQEARRHINNGYWPGTGGPGRANSEDPAFYSLRRAAAARRMPWSGTQYGWGYWNA